MATGNYAFTQNLYAVVGRTAQILRSTPQAIANTLNVYGNATTAKGEFAKIANRKQRKVLSDIPTLSATSATLNVTASGNSAAIPATLFRKQVIEIEYLDSNSWANKLPIRFIGKLDSRSLPPDWRNGNVTSTNAMLVALDETESNFLFFPTLSQATTFTVKYQSSPTAFVAADFDNSASTTYSVVPDDYDDLLPMMCAVDVARAMGRPEIEDRLRLELFGDNSNKNLGRYEEVKREMLSLPAMANRFRYGYTNNPTAALLDDPLAGQFFGSIPGLRR